MAQFTPSIGVSDDIAVATPGSGRCLHRANKTGPRHQFMGQSVVAQFVRRDHLSLDQRVDGGCVVLYLCNLARRPEVVSALRGMARRSPVLRSAVPDALRHLACFPIRRMPLAPLLERMWELRENITPYDAAYVTLAERLAGPLITCDGKLATASGARCAFDLIT